MVRSLFVTQLYEAEIGDDALLGDLAHSIRSLARDDEAGVRWSKEHRYSGYTSYASLNDLPRRDPAIAELGKLLTRHAVKFAKDCAFHLDRKPRWARLHEAVGHERDMSIRAASSPGPFTLKFREDRARSASRTRGCR
jgi:uncharacterized protein (TIGR02466 family)